MNKTMKELHDFIEKRELQLKKHDEQAAAVAAEIQQIAEEASKAMENGDIDHYMELQQRLDALKTRADYLKEIRKGFERPWELTDDQIRRFWDQYVAEYEKAIEPKMKALRKARKEFFAALIEVLTAQREAINDRESFQGHISKSTDYFAFMPVQTALQLKSKVNIKKDAFKNIFKEELKDADGEILTLVSGSDNA